MTGSQMSNNERSPNSETRSVSQKPHFAIRVSLVISHSSFGFVNRYSEKPHHAVAMLQRFNLPPGPRNCQCVSLGMAEDKQSVGCEQARQFGVVEELLGRGGRASANILFSVGRVS